MTRINKGSINVNGEEFQIEYADNYINQEWIYTCRKTNEEIGSITTGWLFFGVPKHEEVITKLLAGHKYSVVYDLG